MRKVIAAVLLTGAVLVACTLYVSEDATRIGPDAGSDEAARGGHHGRRDAGVLDGGAPGDGPLSTGDGGAPGDGPLFTDCGVTPGDGPLPPPDDGPLPPPDDGPLSPPDDRPLPPLDGGPLPPLDGPRPRGDGSPASSLPRSAASSSAR
ncbi:MAG TPA: hypothetical protein VLM79_30240 [Kofleriaceae bacterium]|nr:hypothetical protein [Kofleriaceae bacterium]